MTNFKLKQLKKDDAKKVLFDIENAASQAEFEKINISNAIAEYKTGDKQTFEDAIDQIQDTNDKLDQILKNRME